MENTALLGSISLITLPAASPSLRKMGIRISPEMKVHHAVPRYKVVMGRFVEMTAARPSRTRMCTCSDIEVGQGGGHGFS